MMPKEVERECYGRPEALDAHLIARAVAEGRISVQAAGPRKRYEKLRGDFLLGCGEAAAITLALASEGALVATDDRLGINACKLLRIRFVTALTVLVRMREKGLLSLEEARSRLEALARFGRYKQDIINAVRVQLEEG